jgi:beta-fructofuranosidase
MRTWRRFAGNPVIPKPPPIPGLADGFRDPFVWREGGGWRMLVGSGIQGQGGTVLLYESADLLSWTFLGPLCTGMGTDCFQWECPNFFPLGDRWVLVVSPLLHSIPSLRGPVQYAVGRYDGRRFEPGEWRPLDLGGPSVFYAPNSLHDDQGRRILWGWIMGGGEPGAPWNGLMTLPRQLELGADLRLRVWPVETVASLRAASLADLQSRELKSGEILEVCQGTQLDVVIELGRADVGRLRVDLFCSAAGDHATAVSFDLASGELRCGDKAGLVPRTRDAPRTLRLLVDRSVVEVYADRREVMSLRTYPPPGADGLRLTAEQSPVSLTRVRAWQMSSIW